MIRRDGCRVLSLSVFVLLAACGGGSSGGSTQGLKLLVGTLGGPGQIDGQGAAARFSEPSSITIDPASGNLYVIDAAKRIRRISPAGDVTTIAGTASAAGSGTQDGPVATAQFYFPSAIAVNPSNSSILVLDDYAVRSISADGIVSTLAGTEGLSGYVDAVGAAARFQCLDAIAVDQGTGSAFLPDCYTIRGVSPGGSVGTLAGGVNASGDADGVGPAAQFGRIAGVAVDSKTGVVYAADSDNHTLRQITRDGVVGTVAGTPGKPLADNAFALPLGLAEDQGSGVLYVSQFDNTIRKVTPAGAESLFAGAVNEDGYADGTGSAARFNVPSGLAVDAAGMVYVADSFNSTIRKITPQGEVSTLAGAPFHGPPFQHEQPVAVDRGSGTIYYAVNCAVEKLVPGASPVVLAGQVGHCDNSFPDGTGAAASFFELESIAVDTSSGTVYVLDTERLRKITANGVVTTMNFFQGASSLDFDSKNGILYLAASASIDSSQELASIGVVYKIAADGTVTDFAGSETEIGDVDGPGQTARFGWELKLAFDQGSGLVYAADARNASIRVIDPQGNVSTLAGSAAQPTYVDGPLATARFASPGGIAVDSVTHTLYVTDGTTVRRVGQGAVSTVLGVWGQQGVRPGPLPGFLNSPADLAWAGNGKLLVSDAAEAVLLEADLL